MSEKMSEKDPIQASVIVERKQSDLPRYAVVPSARVAPWNLTATTTVEVAINGVAVPRRSIHRWDDERWFLSITERDCQALNIDTGSSINLSLCMASTDLPLELAELVHEDRAAKRAWEAMTPSQQRMLREEIASAKRPSTRSRRARRALLGK